jgi:outer membrane protein OmpA-like peptidoglycan-associated protein
MIRRPVPAAAIAASLVAAWLIAGGTAGLAHAQPVSFELRGDVPVGQLPALRVTAVQRVTDLRVDLERGDGKRFSRRHAALAPGQVIVLPVGDGAPGKAAYRGTISAQLAGGERWSDELVLETLVRAPLRITYDAEHLDLDRRTLQFQLSRPAGSAEITAIGEDGAELGTGSATYRGEPAGTWLPISWTQPTGSRVLMLNLRAVSREGLAARVELIPWSVEVEHEDVHFATDSAAIPRGEEAKLDASFAKIAAIVARSEGFVKLRLYVAGHTDTVGPPAKNRALSQARARAIGAYFRRKGLAIPIAVAGFGEDVLRVRTADSVDEAANRRADYVLGPADAAPPFRGPYLKARAVWRPIP